jgi:hypothetical protein
MHARREGHPVAETTIRVVVEIVAGFETSASELLLINKRRHQKGVARVGLEAVGESLPALARQSFG